MRSWCRNHPVIFMAGYLVFYLAFFVLLEKTVQVPDLVLHCALDDLISFCKYAIIPYYLWFAWIPGTLFFFLWKGTRWDFWRLCLPLFVGMTLALLFCAVVPNGVYLRPSYVPGTDVFARAVRELYHTDTPTNVFPSIHVLNAVTLDLAWQRYVRRGSRKLQLLGGGLSHLLMAAIVASTMLLKQHSAMDAMGGILLALLLDHMADHLTAWWYAPHGDRLRKMLERV
nr:phosphatase PAP2 family protein [uncultured Gemmiger sp.]